MPEVIEQHLPAWMDAWLARCGRRLADIESWAIHPGGPRILSACTAGLGLQAPSQTQTTGNMQAAQRQGQGQPPGQQSPMPIQSARAGNFQQRGAAGQLAPQITVGNWQTLDGEVSAYSAPNFVLQTADGQTIPVQLGNLSYLNQIGLQLADGQSVTLVGAPEGTAGFAVKSITVDGNIYSLRDENGRPLWAGRGNK